MMEQIREYEYKVKTEGMNTDDYLLFSTGPSSCGKIEDGIVLYVPSFGAFVIPYIELLEMVRTAKEARGYQGDAGNE